MSRHHDRNRKALQALAWSLPDIQPSPTLSRSYDIRGEAPGPWQPCPDCDGQGTTQDRYRRTQPCPTCSGAGRYRIDPITLNRVAANDSHAPSRTRRALCDRCQGHGTIPATWIERQHQRAKTRNRRVAHSVSDDSHPARASGMARCPSCDGDGKVSVPLDTGSKTAPLVVDDGSALARLRAQGDWDALEAALRELATIHPDQARAWRRARVGGTPPHSEATDSTVRPFGVSRVVSDAEVWLLGRRAWRCPAGVLVAFEAAGRRGVGVEGARVGRVFRGGRRDLRIRELVRSGRSIAEAAAACGVSPRTVSRVLARGAA